MLGIISRHINIKTTSTNIINSFSMLLDRSHAIKSLRFYMEENKILDFITSEYSWEQVVYKIIAWEGLDPWNLDITALSNAFVQYINKLKRMDFKIPAKYIIISSILLRMKSDHLQYIGDLVEGGDYIEPDMEEDTEPDTQSEEPSEIANDIEINPITIPPNRQPRRKIVIDDLMKALKSALRTKERRILRKRRARKKIHIENDNISLRISRLYQKINDMLSRIKKSEVKFSNVVDRWDRENIIDAFLPLVFLEHERKIKCRQEEMFKDIFIKKREN